MLFLICLCIFSSSCFSRVRFSCREVKLCSCRVSRVRLNSSSYSSLRLPLLRARTRSQTHSVLFCLVGLYLDLEILWIFIPKKRENAALLTIMTIVCAADKADFITSHMFCCMDYINEFVLCFTGAADYSSGTAGCPNS